MNRWTLLGLVWGLSVSTGLSAQSVDLWVVDQDIDAVVGLDHSGEVVTSTDLPGSGFGTAVASDGTAWISIAGELLMVRVGPTGIESSCSTPTPVHSIAVAADGVVWAVSPSTSEVHRFDSTGLFLGSSPVGSVPYGVAIDRTGRAWVTNAFGNSVTRLEADGSGGVEFPVGFYPTGIAAHPNGTIWVIDKTAVSVLDEDGVVLSEQAVGTFPRGVTIALDGDVWVSDQSAHSVLHFAADGSLIAEHPVGFLPWGIAASGDGTVSVLCRWAGEVWRISDGGAVLALTDVGYPNGFGDLSGLQLALTVLPEADFDGDEAPNLLESASGADPLDAASHPVTFVRGDATRDGTIDLDDVWVILADVGEAPCREALDVDDSGTVDLADAIGLLGYLFSDGPAPTAPFPAPSYDLSPGAGLPCEE